MTEKEIKTKINNNEENTAEEFLEQLTELYQKQLLNENWKGALLGLGLGASIQNAGTKTRPIIKENIAKNKK